MKHFLHPRAWTALVVLAGLIAGPAGASTIAQNSSWTITRPGSSETLRVVAYGDSIYAGYISIFSVAKRAAPHVAGEYGAALWGQNVQVIRRCQSGAVASGVYNRINSATDRAFMQTANTRVVAFEMCGNDYLQARSSFKGQSGTCNYTPLTNAGNNCKNFTELAMQSINANANANVKLKIVSNLYYPGWNADNVLSNCNDPVTGQKINFRERFFPLLAESNWTTCKLAEQYGFECADAFADYMAGDYDSNDDGLIDSDAIRYRSDESLEDYVQRVTVDLLSTIRDSNFKMVSATTSVDYLLSDDTHPTNTGGTGSSGTTAVQFPTAGPYPDGKNPAWNLNGHDRLGHGLTPAYTLDVDAGPDATILECEDFESAGSFEDNVFMGPWMLDISYGDGGGSSETVTDMTFDLANQYTAPGTYDVDVVVEGSYGVTGADAAVVTVLSALAGYQNLKDWVAALHTAGSLTFGQANSLTNTIKNVPAKLATGHPASAQSMLQDFINKVGPMVASGPLSAEDGQALIDYAARISAAATCNPVAKTPWGQLKKTTPAPAEGPEPEVENELFGDEFDPELVLLELEEEEE